jgi:hypothetical protein
MTDVLYALGLHKSFGPTPALRGSPCAIGVSRARRACRSSCRRLGWIGRSAG